MRSGATARYAGELGLHRVELDEQLRAGVVDVGRLPQVLQLGEVAARGADEEVLDEDQRAGGCAVVEQPCDLGDRTLDVAGLRWIWCCRELTGEPGDVILMHPRTLHVTAPNTGDHPRMMLVESSNAGRLTFDSRLEGPVEDGGEPPDLIYQRFPWGRP